MLSKGNLFIKNLSCTIRTFHSKAVVIGNVQDTKSSTYQVRTIVYIHTYIYPFIHICISISFINKISQD